jgi:zinc transporter ZupT
MQFSCINKNTALLLVHQSFNFLKYMALLLGLAALISTLCGGFFALKKQDKLHLILGFSAGAVIGVAFFDLLPEALRLASERYDVSLVTTLVAIGFLTLMVLNRFLLIHPHTDEHCENDSHTVNWISAASLSVHSFLDGIGIGLAFQVSPAVGLVVAVAVLAHDFSDGINTVSVVLNKSGDRKQVLRWLAADALAPFLGVFSTRFFTVPEAQLGLILALFCGFFLYIGAGDLLPESHHRHPKFITSIMTVLGALVIYLAIHFSSL